MSRSSFVSVAVVVVTFAVGCGGDGGTDPSPNPDSGSIAVSPGLLTLNVGGTGSLTADVRDGSGATVSATVAWITRNPLVASISDGGNVIGVSVGQTMAVATSAGKRDSALVVVLDDLTLQVVPSTGTVQTGRTFPFSVVARNGAGQVIATPAVTWGSSNQAIATINASGVATGVTRGITLITASARGVTSAPATLTVGDPSASACDGIISVSSWDAVLEYQYAVSGTSEGGFAISSDNKGGTLKATLMPEGPLVEPLLAWKGKLSGTASLHETKSGGGSGVEKLDGQGQVLTIAGGYEPTMSIIVDTRNCTYRMAAVTTLVLTRTNESGGKFDSETPVATIQVGLNTALGAWRDLGLSDLAEGDFPGHSLLWLGAHPDKNGFAALGFATELTKRGFEEPPVGNATVSYTITRKN